MNIIVDSAIRTTVGCFVALLFAAATFTAGPEIEQILKPVVRGTKAASIPFTGTPLEAKDANHVILTTTKIRPSCKLEDTSAAVLRNGSWIRGTIKFKDATTGELVTSRALRPAGAAVVDELFIFPEGERVRMELMHSCHLFWNVRTVLFELETKK